MKPTLRKLFFCAFLFTSWSLFGQEVDTIFHMCTKYEATEGGIRARVSTYFDDCIEDTSCLPFYEKSYRERLGGWADVKYINNSYSFLECIKQIPQYGEYFYLLNTGQYENRSAFIVSLQDSLQSYKCYQINAVLSYVKNFYYGTNIEEKDRSYKDKPIVLKIYGAKKIANLKLFREQPELFDGIYFNKGTYKVSMISDAFFEKVQLLNETPVIDHSNWLEYTLQFSPKENYSHLIVQADYEYPTSIPYSGNILLDHLSPITSISCDSSIEWAMDSLDEQWKLYEINKKERVKRRKTSGFYKKLDDPSIGYGDGEYPPIWLLDEVPNRRLVWQNELTPPPRGLPFKQIPYDGKSDLDFLELFGRHYGTHILQFVIDMSNPNKAKRLRKEIIEEAKYWEYPDWAYDFTTKKG